MEFLSTDNKECQVDYLLSETNQDFTEELRLLMEAHDALCDNPMIKGDLIPEADLQSIGSDQCSSDSGVVSPGSSTGKDELFYKDIFDSSFMLTHTDSKPRVELQTFCSTIDPSSLSQSSAITATESSSHSSDIVTPSSFQSLSGNLLSSITVTPQSSVIPSVQATTTSTIPSKPSETAGLFLDRNKKNAIAAKLNRQKKKEYVQSLEAQVSTLQSENKQLKAWHSQTQHKVIDLESEVRYLKNVLANQSTLSNLLQNIPQIDNVQLTTSFGVTCKRSRFPDDNDASHSKKTKSDNLSSSSSIAGVCLHVLNNTASLEFCSECSLRHSTVVTPVGV